ncbi:MAG: hypothetical protein K2J67_04290 [Lachnospiraceae bacterium]|nr:hypothetical protein [Lachnospiraceae bacterium]
MKELVVHNGIFCGDEKLFYDANDRIIGSIYLLMDKFRPNVDFSRNIMHKVSLETMCVLSVLFQTMEMKENPFKLSEKFRNMIDYPYCPAQAYWDILDKHDYLIDKLSFTASVNNYTVESLLHRLKLKQKVLLYPTALVYKFDGTSIQLAHVYHFLCLAYLRKNFILKVIFNRTYSLICVVEEGCDMPMSSRNILPSYFFIPPFEDNCPYLTAKAMEERCACNANHPFSQFILNNCVELNEYANGYLTKILHMILEEDYLDIIEKINGILTSLRAIPNGLFNISDDLYLTEYDFA